MNDTRVLCLKHLFRFLFVFLRSLKPRSFVRPFFDMYAPRQSHADTIQPSVSSFVSVSFFENVSFSECFCTNYRFLLFGEYVVGFALPGGVFLPCDHRLEFLHQFCKNSVKIKSRSFHGVRASQFLGNIHSLFDKIWD